MNSSAPSFDFFEALGSALNRLKQDPRLCAFEVHLDQHRFVIYVPKGSGFERFERAFFSALSPALNLGNPSATWFCLDESFRGDLPKIPFSYHEFSIKGEKQSLQSGQFFITQESLLKILDLHQAIGLFYAPKSSELPSWEYYSPLKEFFHLWCLSHQKILIHGGSLYDPATHVGTLFVGKGGAGKSTATTQGMGKGLLSCGDDYVVVCEKTRTLHALYQTIKLWPSEAFPIPVKFYENPYEIEPHKHKTVFFLKALLCEKMPLSKIIVRSSNTPLNPTLIPPGKALIECTLSSLAQLPYRGEMLLKLMRSVLDHIPTQTVPFKEIPMKSQQEILSVVLPVFNGASYLSEAIESVLNQENSPFEIEIIAVNDGSSDHSKRLLDEWSQQYPQIKVIHFEKNRGAPTARSTGVQAASGTWLSFIDQDDCWAPTKINTQYAYLQSHPELQFVLSHQKMNLLAGHERPRWAKETWLQEPQCGYVLGCILIKKSDFVRVGLFDPTLQSGGDDVEWFIRAKQAGLCYELLAEILLYRKIHGTNASQRTLQSNHELFHILRRKIHTEHTLA